MSQMDNTQEPEKASQPTEAKKPIIKFSGEVDFPALKGSWPNVRKVAQGLLGLTSDTLRDLEAQKRLIQIQGEIEQVAKALGDSRYLGHLLHDLSKKHENKRNILVQAMQSLETDEASQQHGNQPAPEVAQDWIDHFGGEAEKISDPRLQAYFAKLLAAEIRSPGTVQKRSVSTLAEMGTLEAQLFQCLCDLSFYIENPNTGAPLMAPMVLTDGIGIPGQNGLLPFGLSFEALTVLMEARVLVPELNASNKIGEVIASGAPFCIGADRTFLNKARSDAAPLDQLAGLLLSRTGMDLHRIVSKGRNASYRAKLFEHWAQLGYAALPAPQSNRGPQN
jgi:hypothetical protein